MEDERALGALDATHKVPRNPGLPREDVQASEAEEQTSDLASGLCGHCPDSMSAHKHTYSGVGLGILEPLEVWPTAQGIMKSYDSQGKTNSIVKKIKVKPELHFCTQICGNP